MARPKQYDYGYPSVTSVIDIIDKPGLRYWYGKFGTTACENIKRESQIVGHGVHKGIERFLTGDSFETASAGLSNDQAIMLSYLTDWCSKVKVKVKQMETPLYSHKFKFAGTPDLICTLGRSKVLHVVDWKTDSTPRNNTEKRERELKYLWQLGGYSIAYKEMFGDTIRKGIIVRASKTLEFNTVIYNDLRAGQRDFKMLRYIYERVKGK